MAKLPERCPTEASIPRLTQGRNYLAFFLPSSLRFRVEERGGCLTRLELEDSAPSARPLWFTLQLGWMESDCACWSSLWTGLLCFCIFSRFSSLGVSWYGIILVSHSDLNFERLGFSSFLIFLANGDILNSWISVFTSQTDHEALTWGAC